jgi:alkanesulfonate monooxygenase
LLAQQALTFDEYSGGRLLFNLVNGTDTVLTQYGVHAPHDERYELSAEYWDAFKKLYSGKAVIHDGRYFKVSRNREIEGPTSLPVPPTQHPHPPLWGAGASSAGVRHAAEIVETYLAFLNRPDRLQKQLGEARSAAALKGRVLPAGLAFWIIVRETEQEAQDHLRWLLETTGAAWIANQVEIDLKRTFGKDASLATLTSEDPQLQRRINALRAGRIPDIEDLKLADHLYTGPTPPSALDVVGTGRGTYLVGDPQQIASVLNGLQRTLGVEVFIMQAHPLEQEAERIAKLLLPLLQLGGSSAQLDRLAS